MSSVQVSLQIADRAKTQKLKIFLEITISIKKGKRTSLDITFPLKYYEIKFHEFFDGIIGSQFLAKNKATIDFQKKVLEIGNIDIPYKKYFPVQKLHFYQLEINTTSDGDWLVPTFQKLNKSAIIEPGLYRSQNNKTTVKILTNIPKLPTMSGELNIKVNNFETLTPIPITDNTELNEETIMSLIRMEHLSELEK